MTDLVRVHVVTYRRPALLERALRSLLGQEHGDWVAEVLNDDPEDPRPAALVQAIGDPRIRMSEPAAHRGGTANFNHAFRTLQEPFASILEDDNWWEPGFLGSALRALGDHPQAVLACGNERLWVERADGTWEDTGRTVWPAGTGSELFNQDPEDKCGSARLCNSSMVFRTGGSEAWRTPNSIPIDVTEHFRERVVPHPVVLLHEPLVNFAVTRHTHRSHGGTAWGEYQCLLIGSVFALESEHGRRRLADALWRRARTVQPQFASTLLATGLSQAEARALVGAATWAERLRYAAGAIRHPAATRRIWRARMRRADAWRFLLRGAFADWMRGRSG